MVNRTMNEKVQKTVEKTTLEQKQAPKRPNESASFSVEAHVKIFDPETKEVYVEKRA